MNIELLKKKPFNLSNEDLQWVKTTFDSLTSDEKIGQIIHGTSMGINQKQLKKIKDLKFTGCHLFAGLPRSVVRGAIKKLQSNSKVPMLISADLEYDKMIIPRGGAEFPMALGVAATGDPIHAERMARVAARESGALGFNWGLTPVTDIDYNFRGTIVNNRSFGSDPDLVLAMASSFVKGMQDECMATSIKHWPGDGMDDRDQHTTVSTNSMDMETWRSTYGRNYKNLIDLGAMTVMSAHIALPAYYMELNPNTTLLKANTPATQSKELNIDLLRNELGFNGLIVSDATIMGGYHASGPREEMLPLSVENGIDIILFTREEQEDFNILKRGLEKGLMSQQRLDEAVLRVLGLKAAIKLHERQKSKTLVPSRKFAAKTIGNPEHLKWAKESVEKSITLVKDTQKVLPISPKTHPRVLLKTANVKTPFGEGKAYEFKKTLEKEGFQVSLHEKIKGPIRKGRFDLIIYITVKGVDLATPTIRIDWYKLHKRSGSPMNSENSFAPMTRYWHEIPTIFISIGNPYVLYEIPYCRTYINAYAPTNDTRQELMDRLLGRKPFEGKSPVDPFCGFEFIKES